MKFYRRPFFLIGLVLSCGGALPIEALANPAQEQRPQLGLFAELTKCRTAGDAEARLACYDATVALMDNAERGGDLVILDRANISAARRQMFGLDFSALPNLFGSEKQSNPITEVETTLVRASSAGGSNWVFILADGTTWRQISSGAARLSDREGQDVRIRRGAVGSYLLTVGNSQAIRVRRVVP